MSILVKQQNKNPNLGYPLDFIDEVKQLAPIWKNRKSESNQILPKLVTNAGGLNPIGCAKACAEVLKQAGCEGLKIGIVYGDDVIDQLKSDDALIVEDFNNLDTKEPLSSVQQELITANAYIGAAPVIEALQQGADLVVTGRVADPSLTAALACWKHGWKLDEWNRIAGATVAGHLIECGTQVCGGISTNWLSVPKPEDIGYPIVEVFDDGSCIVTKPDGTGGVVNQWTVKEQLLYELGNPNSYISPDVIVDFTNLCVEELETDRVRVTGAIGTDAPNTLKVSGTYENGFKATGMLVIPGPQAVEKGRRAGQAILDRLELLGCKPEHSNLELLGAGEFSPKLKNVMNDSVANKNSSNDPSEIVLRLGVRDSNRNKVETFSREWMALVTHGPQGTTGYAGGRPKVQQVVGYWPCLIRTNRLQYQVELIEV